MFAANMLSRSCLVSLMGIVEYILVISSEANLDVGVAGVCFSSRVRSVEFLTLNVYGSEANCLILVVSSWESLYARTFLQLTTGRIGWSGLCSFIRPFIVGAEGFKFTYLHFKLLIIFTVLLVHVVGSTPPSALRHSTPFTLELVKDFLIEHTKLRSIKSQN